MIRRVCQVCGRDFDPATVGQGVAQGLCSRTCQVDRARLRSQERASRRRVPPRAPSRLFSPSSRDWTQAREKVDAEGSCRVCPAGKSCGRLEAAHVIPRSVAPNGGEDPRGIVPLGRRHHDEYDLGALDLLPFLSVEEQAYAVELAGGLLSALRVISGKRVGGGVS